MGSRVDGMFRFLIWPPVPNPEALERVRTRRANAGNDGLFLALLPETFRRNCGRARNALHRDLLIISAACDPPKGTRAPLGTNPPRTIAGVRLCQSCRLTAVGIPSLNYVSLPCAKAAMWNRER